MKKLDGKIALITGSSSGIGKEIALLFAKEGAFVIVTSNISKEEGINVVKEIREKGGNAIYFSADLSTTTGVDKLFQEISTVTKKIDILINNAGKTTYYDLFSLTENSLLEDLHTNYISTVLCSKKVLEFMEYGSIINTTSLRGINGCGRPEIIGYSAAKAAVNNFTKNFALEVAPKICVNAIAPGMVLTQFIINNSSEKIKEWKKKIPLGELVDAKELAEVYLLLATTRIFTGSILVPDCGYSLKAD